MSPTRFICRARLQIAFALALLAGLILLGLWAGEVRAAACDTSWTGGGADSSWFTAGNWSGGVPTASTNACIDKPGTYTVLISGQTATAESLELGVGAASGVQTLEIAGTNDGSAHEGELDLTNGGLIGSTGHMSLTALCSTAGCTTGAPAAVTNTGSTPLVNQGTVIIDPGSDGGSSGRAISADLTNQGTIAVDAPLTYAIGSLDNQGTISLDGGQTLTLPCCQMPSLNNDSGGQITNGGGTGHVTVKAQATFSQGAGTTSPAGASPANPAVIVDNSAFIAGPPTLSYTGAGASTIEARGTVALSGSLASGQNLVINAVAGCPGQTLVNAASSFTNAGTITLTGTCDSGLKVGGTLTNTGTLTTAATGSGVTREIEGSLTNAGALNINGATAFDGGGATLSQTAGTTTLSPSAILDTSGSGATFALQGGILTGGGQTTATQAYIGGPVNNSGGNVIPGSLGSPGLMTIGGAYTQGAGGKLTVVVKGAGGPSGRGTHYSQLASTAGAVLGGTLAISTLSNPSLGDLDTILATNGGVSGTFSTVTGAFSPGSSFGYQTTYGSNYAALSVGPVLRVKKAGPGRGTVTSSPSGINCGAVCAAPFGNNQTVTLTEHPGAGWAFGGWSGGCTGSATTCQVQMSQARTVTATFSHLTTTSLSSSRNPSRAGRQVTYRATVSPHPNGGTVKFTSGGRPISGCGAVAVNASTGKAACSVTYRSKGTRRIRAAYSGDPSYAHSTSSVLRQAVRR